jgi:hypothetical protein
LAIVSSRAILPPSILKTLTKPTVRGYRASAGRVAPSRVVKLELAPGRSR